MVVVRRLAMFWLEFQARVNPERTGMIRSINLPASRSRRKTELSPNFAPQLPFDRSKRDLVVSLGVLQHLKLGQVFDIRHLRVLKRR
jgi:hypothetical protein